MKPEVGDLVVFHESIEKLWGIGIVDVVFKNGDIEVECGKKSTVPVYPYSTIRHSPQNYEEDYYKILEKHFTAEDF